MGENRPKLEECDRVLVVDADADAHVTATSVSNAVKKIANVRIPPKGGWGRRPGGCRVGFCVTPPAPGTGEIETLVWDAWSNDPCNAGARACVESFLACMTGIGLSGKSPDKAKVSALLAVRNDEDPRLGPGARAGAFDFSRPEFAALVGFLDGLRKAP